MTIPQGQRWQGRYRIAPAIAALLINAIIGYALIMGLRGPALWQRADDAPPLALFDLRSPERENPPPPPRQEIEAKEEGGSPSARKAEARETRPALPNPASLTAPIPIIVTPNPPLPATPASSMTSGAGDGGGNGFGTGEGRGTGTGSGSGQGDGDGTFSRARQTGGRFRNSDFPDSLRGVGRVKIGVRYAIGPSGQVDKCEVIEGSGYSELDAMTCRIIMERYRFRPARDPDGYAVTEVREEDYRWRVR